VTEPWLSSMPEEQFELMQRILGAPSPVGLEAAMTMGVIRPYLESTVPSEWSFDTCRGNAGLVVDSHPGRDDLFSVMVIGHADKIRLQVRSIGEDGKIWINSDSFLPMTLVGHEVILFSQDPAVPGSYRSIRGGTIEALGAIHFADAALRTGEKGITKEMLYLELQLTGEDRKKKVEALGIKSGDTILLDRKIRRGFSKDTYYGAYLDNGLGCFVATELARLVAEKGGLDNVRTLFAMATHEEIGRMGSRVLVGEYRPDVVIAVDVAHDLDAAPGVKDRRYTPNAMGKGFTLSVGSITSEQVNGIIEKVCRERDIPLQLIVKGRDTGTDAMAAVFAAVDSAAVSIGVPIRNMHTISETGHTSDVLTAIFGILAALEEMDRIQLSADMLRQGHPRLDCSTELTDP
jgi:putative aminopeptidase FrvX